MGSDTATTTIGIVGARGYVGRELIKLLDSHPTLELSLACSSSSRGASVRDTLDHGPPTLRFTAPDPGTIAANCPDVLVLALPNGHASKTLAAIDRAGVSPTLVLDLSADMRFDPGWTYAIPELHADRLIGATRIANPGCYATAMQFALAPLIPLFASSPYCFGVSGYSGAGTTPSPRNNTGLLEGGVTPYALSAHVHEKEVAHHINHPVRFAPSVAPFFRGIVLTALIETTSETTTADLESRFNSAYASHPLVSCIGQEMPRVQDVANTPCAFIGGITVNPEQPTHAAVVCVIDNLLKGAASQALQNLNASLGLDPLAGIHP